MNFWNYIYIGAGFLGSLVTIGLAVKGCIVWIKDRKKNPSTAPEAKDGSNRDHEEFTEDVNRIRNKNILNMPASG